MHWLVLCRIWQNAESRYARGTFVDLVEGGIDMRGQCLRCTYACTNGTELGVGGDV